MSRVGILFILSLLGACAANEPPQAEKAPAPPRAAPPVAPPAALEARLKELGEAFDGEVGIAVRDVESGWTAAYRGDVLMPQQSVSKLWVAITLLEGVDRGHVRLDDATVVTRDDLSVFHQPLRRHIDDDGYTVTYDRLLQLALRESDNAANNALLNRVGGPGMVRKLIEHKKLGAIRFGPGENVMQAEIAGLTWQPEYSYGMAFKEARASLPDAYRRERLNAYVADPVDGASASAIVAALAKLKRGELLSPASTQYLLDAMAKSRTGPKRLRGGLSEGWTIAHKTGTGQDLGAITAGYNDVAIVTAPDGQAYAVAVMIGKTRQGIPARWALMNAVARTVVDFHEKRLPQPASETTAAAKAPPPTTKTSGAG